MARKVTVIVIYLVLFTGLSRESPVMNFRYQNLTSVPDPPAHRGSVEPKHLFLSANHITTLEECAFHGYHNLKTVDLIANHISNVSPHAFMGAHIANLALANNSLQCIPDLSTIHASLETLSLSINQLHRCKTSVTFLVSFGKLNILALNYNKLIHLGTITILCVASNLQSLYLMGNKLKQVPNLLHQLPQLTHFSLSGNPTTCSCENGWMKQIERAALNLTCGNFGTLTGRKWDELRRNEVENSCQSSNRIIESEVIIDVY